MIVIADASPLIALLGIGQLSLLATLYERVTLPDAVREEIDAGATPEQRAELASATWLERRAVADQPLLVALRDSLDRGEAQAIALALERTHRASHRHCARHPRGRGACRADRGKATGAGAGTRSAAATPYG